MAVATQTKHRKLDGYRTLRHGELQVLITPELTRLAPTLRVSSRRWVTKGFQVEFPDACDMRSAPTSPP